MNKTILKRALRIAIATYVEVVENGNSKQSGLQCAEKAFICETGRGNNEKRS